MSGWDYNVSLTTTLIHVNSTAKVTLKTKSLLQICDTDVLCRVGARCLQTFLGISFDPKSNIPLDWPNAPSACADAPSACAELVSVVPAKLCRRQVPHEVRKTNGRTSPVLF